MGEKGTSVCYRRQFALPRRLRLDAWVTGTGDGTMLGTRLHMDAESIADTSHALRSLDADGINDRTLAAALGLTEDDIASLLEDTVRAWREFLCEISGTPGGDGE
jgi:hypothetical protein